MSIRQIVVRSRPRRAQACSQAAEGTIAVAARRVPQGDVRVTALASLLWQDDGFEAVTAFNSRQSAADLGAALAEYGALRPPRS